MEIVQTEKKFQQQKHAILRWVFAWNTFYLIGDRLHLLYLLLLPSSLDRFWFVIAWFTLAASISAFSLALVVSMLLRDNLCAHEASNCVNQGPTDKLFLNKFSSALDVLSRSREASEWDLEEKQLAERHALNKQELKDRFYLQRTQMLARHQRVSSSACWKLFFSI